MKYAEGKSFVSLGYFGSAFPTFFYNNSVNGKTYLDSQKLLKFEALQEDWNIRSFRDGITRAGHV